MPSDFHFLVPESFHKNLAQIGKVVSENIRFEFCQRIYTRLPGGSLCIKMVICTAALQYSQPNRLYTRPPGVNIKLLFTRQPCQSHFSYIHGCRVSHKIAVYTAAIQEPNRLYTLLPGVYKKSLFTRQPFKSQIGYIHCCRVY